MNIRSFYLYKTTFWESGKVFSQIMHRRQSGRIFEPAREMVNIAVAEHQGDLTDPVLAALKQSFRTSYTQILAVLHHRGAKLLTKAVAEIGLAYVAKRRNVGQSEVLARVTVDIRESRVQVRGAASRYRAYTPRKLHQEAKKQDSGLNEAIFTLFAPDSVYFFKLGQLALRTDNMARKIGLAADVNLDLARVIDTV